jgi:hypothetical protein
MKKEWTETTDNKYCGIYSSSRQGVHTYIYLQVTWEDHGLEGIARKVVYLRTIELLFALDELTS